MPPPPDVSPLTQHFLDSPWLVAALLGAGVVVFAILAHRRGERRLLVVAGVLAAAAIASIIVERLATTSGERAEAITRSLVRTAENADVAGARALFADDALMSLANPRNPGVGIDVIERRLETLDGRYRIAANRITSLESYSESSDRGVVHLRVTTELEGGMGYPTPSAWVIEVERQPDGRWLVTHLTFVEYNLGRTPGSEVFR
jgi:hypothetical protein